MGIFNSEKQAYPGTRESTFLCDPRDVTIIGLDTPDVQHELLDEERNKQPLTEEWLNLLMAVGQKVDVLVRKIKRADGTFIIAVVDGRQRVRGLREINKRLVAAGQPPVQLSIKPEKGKTLSMEDLAFAMAACNVTVPESTLSKAKKASAMLARNVARERVALVFGVSPRTIDNWMTLLSTGEEVQDAVARGEITATAAIEIAKAPPAEEAKALGRARSSAGKRRSSAARAKWVVEKLDEYPGLSRGKLLKLFAWIAGNLDDEDCPIPLPPDEE